MSGRQIVRIWIEDLNLTDRDRIRRDRIEEYRDEVLMPGLPVTRKIFIDPKPILWGSAGLGYKKIS